MNTTHTPDLPNKDKGVWISPSSREKFREFEDNYLKVRATEQRLMTDEQVRQLPHVPASHPDHTHWRIRRKNLRRFLNYMKSKDPLQILDIGCGNGFLSGKLSQMGHTVTGIDVNLTELHQAARVFGDEKITWHCGDVIADLAGKKFDLAVLFCSVQYFPSLNNILSKVLELLVPGGEMHLVDSPFYASSEVRQAAARSAQYYQSKGVSVMSGHYYHHTYEELAAFKPHFLYRPSFVSRLLRDSPFPWIRIIR